jgi:hypothetical protein
LPDALLELTIREKGEDKAKALCEAAQKSIGVKQIGSADRYRVRMCLEEVKRTVLTLKDKDMDRQLKCMVKDIPSASYLKRKLASERLPFSFTTKREERVSKASLISD